MLKQNLDEWMYLLGQDAMLDELDETNIKQEEDHHFSDDYRKKQKMLLDSICSDENIDETEKVKDVINEKKSKKRWSKSAIAAALVLIIGSASVTTYAAGRYFLTDHEKRGNVLTVGMDGESDSEGKVAELAYQFGYIPKGYEEWQPRYYSKNGEYGGHGFYVMQWQGIDTTFEYLEKRTETTINGKKAYCYQMGDESDLVAAVQVMYNEEGAMYTLFSDDKEISLDELIKIAQGMTVTETGEYWDIIDEKSLTVDSASQGEVIPADHMKQIGDTVEWSTGHESEGQLSVKEIEILTNTQNLSKEGFSDYDKVSPFIDDSGNLIKIAGITDVEDKNGIHEETEEKQVVLVKVSCEVTNSTNERQEYYMNTLSLEGIEQSGDHVYMDYNAIPYYKNGVPGYMIYMTQAQHTAEDERNSFFAISLDPGESVNCDCAFLTYESNLEDTALLFNPTGGEIGPNSEYIMGWKLQ